MKLLRLLSLCILLVPGLVLAHAELTDATPRNGSTINVAPADLILTFSEEVQLLKLSVSGINSKLIPTSFKPSAATQATFSVPLPGMKQDAYVVAFTVLGKDGHQVEGKLTFILDADATVVPGIAPQAHADHAH